MTVDVSDLVGKGLTAEQIGAEIKRREQANKPVFKPFSFQFVINPYRRDRDKLPPKPIKRSRYAKQLFEIGSGWNE